MKCPVCVAAELMHDTRDQTYTYKGETASIAAVNADYCDACGESLTGLEESHRVMTAMRAFSQQVNASLEDPAFIANVRKNWPSISAKPPKYSAVALTLSRATRPARPNHRWR